MLRPAPLSRQHPHNPQLNPPPALLPGHRCRIAHRPHAPLESSTDKAASSHRPCNERTQPSTRCPARRPLNNRDFPRRSRLTPCRRPWPRASTRRPSAAST
eukprot:5237519-Prymnesium_polylepis.1